MNSKLKKSYTEGKAVNIIDHPLDSKIVLTPDKVDNMFQFP
jgi:hypothetical protein